MQPSAVNRSSDGSVWDFDTLTPSRRLLTLGAFFFTYGVLVYLGYALKETAFVADDDLARRGPVVRRARTHAGAPMGLARRVAVRCRAAGRLRARRPLRARLVRAVSRGQSVRCRRRRAAGEAFHQGAVAAAAGAGGAVRRHLRARRRRRRRDRGGGGRERARGCKLFAPVAAVVGGQLGRHAEHRSGHAHVVRALALSEAQRAGGAAVRTCAARPARAGIDRLDLRRCRRTVRAPC